MIPSLGGSPVTSFASYLPVQVVLSTSSLIPREASRARDTFDARWSVWAQTQTSPQRDREDRTRHQRSALPW